TRAAPLCVHVEDTRQDFSVDADAGIPYANDEFTVLDLSDQINPSASSRVLESVIQQISDHLRNALGVDVQYDRPRWQRAGELVALRIDRGPADLHRLLDDLCQRGTPLLQSDFAVGQALDIEQIVHQAEEVQNLPP